MWLFLGLIIAFSFWNVILQDPNLLNAQIETYCGINSPGSVADCIAKYSFTSKIISSSNSVSTSRLTSIIGNNFGVLILTLIFSLIFGAGAIFVLAWNASVISAAIGVFTKYDLKDIPFGLLRYMVHGFPEIAAYFITALAGGMFGVGVARHGVGDKKFTKVMMHVGILLLIAIATLIIAALMEVYFTPLLFR